MSDQSMDKGDTGTSDHEQHRAGPNEGVRAPLSRDSGGPSQTSIFDGKGNETVVVLDETEDGVTSQGTGPSTEAALENAKDPGDTLGPDFAPGVAKGH